MPTKITGGCACGAIRYEVTAEPIVTFNCHCRDCQKTTGSGYTPVFYAPANAFKITKGMPKYYKTTSEMMGDNIRGFLSGVRFATVRRQERLRTRYRCRNSGRSEVV